MADNATIRLNKVLRELNISLDRAVDYLGSKGHDIDAACGQLRLKEIKK